MGLGFGRRANDPAPAPAPHVHARTGQTQLLGAIGDFLLINGLEITPANLAIAHGVCSGLNPPLRRRILSMTERGEPITQEWLERATAADQPDSEQAMDQLIERLETGIESFTSSTRKARSASSLYNSALEAHVGQLEGTPADASEVITELAGFAKAMLERSRKAEADLRESENEAAHLRKNLDRAKQDAEHDHLTGLPNRRAFEGLLDQQYREAQAAVDPMCVAFCDIDYFKKVNDTHGHEAGDRVIRVIAETLSHISDEKCHVARHGGEEFVMLFRGLTPAQAKERLDLAREELAARKLVNRKTEKPFGQITFSGGVADVFAYHDPREALAAADEALYAAKESGRNRVELASIVQG
ncbi:MAG: GGDEF domain-containing protein [Sphingomonadaceae bacterium]|nr:GGDEF domain-containing protein [Sphingomonadaceae bacterium]